MKKLRNIGGNIKIDFLFIFILFLLIFLINLPLANFKFFSPDACSYLDIGRNLFSGRGAVISYNLNQFWPGRYYPFLPYMPPIFPIIAGLLWFFFSLKTVIVFNILLLAINCALLYKIIRFNATYLISFLIALFMGFSNNIVTTAILPWSEQLHLFFLLLAIFIYLKSEKYSFFVGVILGISCFVRVVSFFNIFAFGIALIVAKGLSKEALREHKKIVFGFLIIFLTYEIFSYLRYGVFYPQYLVASRSFTMARLFPGAFYKMTLPVLNMPPLKLGLNTILTNLKIHFTDFVMNFGQIKFVFILLLFYPLLWFFRKKNSLFIFFFFQGICTIFGYSLCHWFTSKTEIARYSLIPLITLGTIGFLSIRDFFGILFPKAFRKQISLVLILIILFIMYLEIKDYLSFRYQINIYQQQSIAYEKDRDEIYEWIKTNSKKDDLIASTHRMDVFLFERPFVSLPEAEVLTEKNLTDFLDIYRPEYILIYNKSNVQESINFLRNLGFREKKKTNFFVLLNRN